VVWSSRPIEAKRDVAMDLVLRKRINDAMVRLAEGDRTAFPMLMDDLWPVVRAFALRSVGQSADAEDIAQDVFVRICARIAEYDRTRDAVSWAFGIATYEVMTHRRRIQRRREVGDAGLPDAVDSADSQEQLLLQREIESALKDVLSVMKEEDRHVLGGYASASGHGVGATQRKRKQRALARFRSLWRSIYGER